MRRHQGTVLAGFSEGQRRMSVTERRGSDRFVFSLRGVRRILGFGAILLLVVACGEEEQVVEEIRAIRTATIGDTVVGQVRKFSGVVRAVNRSALSFEVGGNVLVVNVDIGATVKKDQILAELDKEPYELEVEKAEAELVTAHAKVKNQQADYDREKSIFDQGAGSERRLDQAEFALKEAQASVDFVVSKLNLTKRDLRKTVLYAPFDGSIGVRKVDPFVDVRRGQRIFEIDAKGDQEVVIGIPETVVHLLSVGMPTEVSFPTLPGASTKGKVTEVGTLAGDGNAFPIKVRLLDPPGQVRSGMTAEATFEFKQEQVASGFLIPNHAVAPTTEPNKGFAFVYQADSSTVKQTPIAWRGVKDNMLIVSEGLSPGDVVATAGVSFLSDGMKVKLMAGAKKAEPEKLVVE